MSSVGEFFSAYEQVMNARDAAGVASLCTEDVVWEDSALIRAEPLHGRAAVRDFFEEYLFRPFPDLRFEILALLGSGDGTRAAERARFSGTFLAPVVPVRLSPTGRPTEFEVAGFFELREGRAAHIRIIVDMLDIAGRPAQPLPRGFGDRVATGLQHLKALRLRRRPAARASGRS